MKRLIVSISFVLLIFNSPVSGQNSILSVTGHVFDMFSGNPIENQIVALNITGNGMNNTYEFISNNQGYWGSDSLVGYTQGTVHASTYDCNGQIHEFIESYFPDLNSFVFDFHICQDTMPGNDCDNWFQYLTNDNWTFQFTGEVFPDEQAMFTWDFGDGSFGNGQQVTHVYEPSRSRVLHNMSDNLFNRNFRRFVYCRYLPGHLCWRSGWRLYQLVLS